MTWWIHTHFFCIAPPSPHPIPLPQLPLPNARIALVRSIPGILYADVGMDLSNVLLEDLPILGLFSRVIMETGTSSMDRVQLSRRIGSQTGGVYATFLADQPSAGGAVADPKALKQFLFLRGKVGVGVWGGWGEGWRDEGGGGWPFWGLDCILIIVCRPESDERGLFRASTVEKARENPGIVMPRACLTASSCVCSSNTSATPAAARVVSCGRCML